MDCPNDSLVEFTYSSNPEGEPRWIFDRNISRLSFWCWLQICYQILLILTQNGGTIIFQISAKNNTKFYEIRTVLGKFLSSSLTFSIQYLWLLIAYDYEQFLRKNSVGTNRSRRMTKYYIKINKLKFLLSSNFNAFDGQNFFFLSNEISKIVSVVD